MLKLVIEIKLGIYRHYKGNLYQVLHIAKHSETEEELVVDRALYQAYGDWVRPLARFADTVDVKGEAVPRFKLIKPLNS